MNMGPGAASAAAATVALVTLLVTASEGAASTTTMTPVKEVFREMRQLAEVSGQNDILGDQFYNELSNEDGVKRGDISLGASMMSAQESEGGPQICGQTVCTFCRQGKDKKSKKIMGRNGMPRSVIAF